MSTQGTTTPGRAGGQGWSGGASRRRVAATAGVGVLAPARRRAARFAFTMIELMVVVVILGILIAIVAGVSTRAVYARKVAATQTTMNLILAAIEEFKEKNPLRAVYDANTRRSYGPYPPYPLRSVPAMNNSVALALDPETKSPGSAETRTLRARFGRDLLNDSTPGSKVNLNFDQSADDDSRALYTYLRVFVPEAVDRIPAQFVKALPGSTGEYVQVTSDGNNPNAKVDVMGFHDAWGVPIDYFLQVRVEWGADPATGVAGLRVTDRQPVLRSRGMDKAAYDARVRSGNPLVADNQHWLFTSELSSPIARVDWESGAALTQSPDVDGFARVPGVLESYGYVKDATRDK